MNAQNKSILPLWEITHNWFRQQNFAISKNFCKSEITTHPDYPALTSVIDFCSMGGGNAFNAVQADASHIHEMNYPVLAHIKPGAGQEYMHLISQASAWDADKDITQHWSGVAIFPEKNARWEHTDNSEQLAKEKRSKFLAAAAVAAGLLIFGAAAFYNSNIYYTIFASAAFIGAIISIFALGSELGIQNDLVKQVCGTVNKAGCDSVLKSKAAKGFLGITPSDASVIYFSAQFLLFCFSFAIPNLWPAAATLALAAIGIVAWSIYTQAVILKQWCALCLGIAAMLVLQFSLALVSSLQEPSLLVAAVSPPFIGFISFAGVFIILTVLLLPLKQLLVANTKLSQTANQFKSWKQDASLFVSQWKEQPLVDTSTWENDLIIGNPSAPLQIIVACNPYCGPCAKAHEKLDELVERFPEQLSVKVRLLFPGDQENELTIAAKEILTTSSSILAHERKQMLTDWFAWMDMEKWAEKWKTEAVSDILTVLHSHSKWIAASEVTHTPTLFLNERRLPGRYDLNRLEKLISPLAEIEDMFNINIPENKAVHG